MYYCIQFVKGVFLNPLSSFRVLSIACGPSIFAVSASDTAISSSLSSYRTHALTAPSLPSYRASAERTALEEKGATGGGEGSVGERWEKWADLPIRGGVYIWDLKTQKMNVP